MAAVYAYHLVQNHPFIDGNKRTGIVSALVFLKINHYTVRCSNNELFDLTMNIAMGKISKDKIAQWFQANTELF